MRTDGRLSRQLHEEYVQFRKQINQLEDNIKPEYHDSMGTQSIPNHDILAGNSRFEQEDNQIQLEHSRAP